VKRLATASSKLFLRHVLWHDVMMCGFTRTGIFLNIILLLILVNPLLAVNRQSNRKEKIRQHLQEERQSEFVKGKSKHSASYGEL
jgi:predicted membrane protein